MTAARLAELRVIAAKLGQVTLTEDEAHWLLDRVDYAQDVAHDARQLAEVSSRLARRADRLSAP